jgi:methionyl-tRNA formyltransferase
VRNLKSEIRNLISEIYMRLLILSNGPFARPMLRALATCPHEVVAVVARPPRAPHGRKAVPGPAQQEAERLGIDVWLPETVNSEDVHRRIRDLRVDLLVVCDYGEILRPTTLAAAPRGAINLHGSLLPKYRGAAPVQWAILSGEAETGNTVIQLTPGLDAGPILAQQMLLILADETAGDLESRLAEAGADLLVETIDRLAANKIQPVAQDERDASRAPRLRKEDGAIDWTQPAEQIQRHVRAMHPWPKAFTEWERPGREPLRLILNRVGVVPGEAPLIALAGDVGDIVVLNKRPEQTAEHPLDRPPPGLVIEAGPRLVIEAGQGAVRVDELQPAGRRAMAIDDFLRGYPVQPGQRMVMPGTVM